MASSMYEGFAAKVLRHLAGVESIWSPPTEEEKRQALLAGAAALDVVKLAQQVGRGSASWREAAHAQLRRAKERLRAVLEGVGGGAEPGG